MLREQQFLRICSRVTFRGLKINVPQLEMLEERCIREADEAAEQIATFGDFNPNSTKQLGEKLTALGATLPRTEKGAFSTAAGALEQLVREGSGDARKLAELVLAYRRPVKAAQTFLVPMRLLVDHADGRVRPVIHTLGADATGRCSASSPNIQQWPREGGYRELFCTDDGEIFISADFASVEVRIAAWASSDYRLSGMIRDEVDLHSVVAELVWGPEFTKGQRSAAKRAVFGRLYGAGLPTIREQLGAYGSKAQQVINALDRAAPGLAAWGADMRDKVRRGMVTYWQHPSGRRTYLPQKESHKSLNYPIQATGREILVDAAIKFERMQPNRTVVPVHDELLVVVPESDVDIAQEMLVQAMTSTLPMGDGSKVPIECELSTPSTVWQSSG